VAGALLDLHGDGAGVGDRQGGATGQDDEGGQPRGQSPSRFEHGPVPSGFVVAHPGADVPY
jgi:hypothetical protein